MTEGFVAARNTATGPECPVDQSAASSEPAADITASVSLAYCSIVAPSELRGSDSPIPRGSKRMRRVNAARPSTYPCHRSWSLAASMDMLLPLPTSTTSIGPSPTTMKARWAPSAVFAYRTSGSGHDEQSCRIRSDEAGPGRRAAPTRAPEPQSVTRCQLLDPAVARKLLDHGVGRRRRRRDHHHRGRRLGARADRHGRDAEPGVAERGADDADQPGRSSLRTTSMCGAGGTRRRGRRP